jgi:hypothetical protein
VEQEGHHITGSKRRLSNSEQGKEHAPQAVSDFSEVTTSASAHDSYQQHADQEDDKLVIAIDDPFPPDEGEISKWVIAESKALSREITPPEQLFFREQGERQDGDCGPAAVIGTLYFIYCLTGRKRMELESLLTYRAIRQFARVHLQQRTLLKAAQLNPIQMVACQTELQCATKDLWTQVPGCQNHMDPYAPDANWIWDQIAQPEAPGDRRQAVWWSDTGVALILRAALRQLPVNSCMQTKVLAAVQVLQRTAGAGTLEIELLNADHGELVIADTTLLQPWVQEQCGHFQVIIFNSRGKHFITYFCKIGLFSSPGERNGAVRLQEIKSQTATGRDPTAGGTQSNHTLGRTATSASSRLY